MKTLNSKTNNAPHPSVKGWSLRLLSIVVLGCMASSAGHTSDREIYQGATYGNASIMMMLDNSGSMDARSIGEDYSVSGLDVNKSGSTYYCSKNSRGSLTNQVVKETIYERLYNDSSVAISGTAGNTGYEVEYCNISGTKYYDRMSRLKMALIPMFSNPKSDRAFGRDVELDKYRIGLGTFFLRTFTEGGGQIEEPVGNLTLDNKKNIIKKIV